MKSKKSTTPRTTEADELRRVTDLYDYAPVGYFTLTGDGKIQKTNLLGAKLLGAERGNLIGRRFGQFVAPESRSIFNAFLEKIFSTGANHESREL